VKKNISLLIITKYLNCFLIINKKIKYIPLTEARKSATKMLIASDKGMRDIQIIKNQSNLS
jgi:hypothetical protein